MRLHGDMRIKMVQSPVRFLTSLPTAFVHALDLFVTAAGSLVLLRTRNGHEGVNLGRSVRTLFKRTLSREIKIVRKGRNPHTWPGRGPALAGVPGVPLPGEL